MGESSKIGTRWYILLSKEKPDNIVFVDQLSRVFIKSSLDLAYCLVLLYHLNFYMLFTKESPVFWGTFKKMKTWVLLRTGTADPYKSDAQGLDTGMYLLFPNPTHGRNSFQVPLSSPTTASLWLR